MPPLSRGNLDGQVSLFAEGLFDTLPNSVCSRHVSVFTENPQNNNNSRATLVLSDDFSAQARIVSVLCCSRKSMAAVPPAAGAAPPTGTVDDSQACQYVCAVCMTKQPLVPNQTVMCTHCAHSTSTSKVFFKLRENHTTYYTV